jgi:hypothetical protein
MKKLIFFILASIGSTCYASGEWVPYNYPQLMIQEQIVTTTIVPQPPQPQIVYQLVPHVVFEKVTIKHRFVFREFEETKVVPKTYWVNQPILIYR